jgi:TPR repeat protein
MRWQTVSCISFLMAIATVTGGCTRPAQGFTPRARLPNPIDVPLVRIVGTGIDIVRMPPGPSASHEQPPANTPDPPQSPPAPTQPPDAKGQLLKLPVTIGRLPSDGQIGWLGITMDSVEAALVASLELPRTKGVLILGMTPGGPADRSGASFGDIIVAFNGEAIEQMRVLCQRMASTTPGREAVLEVWRVADGNFLQKLHRLGESGNPDIMYRLGKMYAAGVGVVGDEAKAIDWYRKGAAAGNAQAMTALAGALLEGRGMEKNAQEAVRLLKVASDKDHLEAMHRLGVLLREGKAVDKDGAEAVRLLTKAGNAGHTPAMVDVGHMYDHGVGVQVDAAKAAMWYKRAADLGNPAAIMNLGNLHLQGKGVARSPVAATALYRKAADLGDSFAMHNMAWTLDKGIGVERRDPAQAADLVLRALGLRNQFSYDQMAKNPHNWSPEFRQALQRKLRDAGFFTGPIDGALRASTIAAIDAHISNSPRKDQRHIPCGSGGLSL